jgi:hypothetical protein
MLHKIVTVGRTRIITVFTDLPRFSLPPKVFFRDRRGWRDGWSSSGGRPPLVWLS